MATLFPPASRATDPRTSRIAEQRMTRTGARLRQRDVILRIMRDRGESMTACEVAAASDGRLDRYAVSRRLPEMEKSGHVSRAGARPFRVYGSQQTVWRVIA